MPLTCHRGERHEYRDERGRRLFSTSQVLQLVEPIVWTDEAAMERGTRLHRLFALLLATHAGLITPVTVPDEYAPFAESVSSWFCEEDVEAVRIEEPAAHPSLPFAGTPDALVRVRTARRLVLLDLKTGQPKRRDRLQLAAYRHLPDYDDAKEAWVLYARTDGSLKVERVPHLPEDWSVFQNGLAILTWREAT